MVKNALYIFTILVLLIGCASNDVAVERQKDEMPVEEKNAIKLAPADKEMLLKQAEHYQMNRDYANALINIVRAERAEGDIKLNGEISQLKNNLIENLNSRAIDEVIAIETDKGLEVPLEYMVFYTEGELIYPAFNIPVSFVVKKGKAYITGKSFTNSNGIAKCEVFKVQAFEEDEVLITANIFLEIEGEVFNIRKLKRDFTLHYQGIKERTIAFVIFERNIDELNQRSISGKQIEQIFIEYGFTVLNGINESNREIFMGAINGDTLALHVYKEKLDSRLIAFTYIESIFSSKVSEDFYFAKSRIAVNVVDALTNKVVFNSVIEDVKGAGNTEEKAGKKAINQATSDFIEKLKVEIALIDEQ